MRRNVLNFLVDLATLLAILALAATGLVMRFVLPPGTGGRGGGGGLALWGLGRHGWGDIHFWTSAVLAGLLVVHVALHWSWVCFTAARLLEGSVESVQGRARRHVSGVVLLVAVIVLLGGFTWYARRCVEPAAGDGGGSGPRWHRDASEQGKPHEGGRRMRRRGGEGGTRPAAGVLRATGNLPGVSADDASGQAAAEPRVQASKSITDTFAQPSLWRLTYSTCSGWSA